jgi:hypothetical protein
MTVLLLPLLMAAATVMPTEIGPSRSLRMVCKLTVLERGEVEVQIENPSDRPLDLTAPAELVLQPSPPRRSKGAMIVDPRLEKGPTSFEPTESASYRASLDLTADVVTDGDDKTRVQIPARATKTWRVRLPAVAWHVRDSPARSGSHPFRQVVPAGVFELRFEVGGWRSREVRLEVDNRGGVTAREE